MQSSMYDSTGRALASFDRSDRLRIATNKPKLVLLAEHAGQRLRISKATVMPHRILERLKRTAIVWLAAYPSVLLVISLVGDVLEDWLLPLRVLVATGIIVPIVANITEPIARASFTTIERAWLRRQPPSAP